MSPRGNSKSPHVVVDEVFEHDGIDEQYENDRILDDDFSPNRINSPNVAVNEELSNEGIDEQCGNDRILEDDFSPETMEKVESMMKTLETDPNKEKTDSVILYKLFVFIF